MAKQPESVRIEVKTKDQAQMLNYALGVVHQTLSSNMEQVADEKLDDFLDNVKWTRKHAKTLSDKFEFSAIADAWSCKRVADRVLDSAPIALKWWFRPQAEAWYDWSACFKKEATTLVGYKGIYRQL